MDLSKHLKYYSVFCFTFFLLTGWGQQAFASENLLPKPREMELMNGSFTISYKTKIYYTKENDEDVKFVIENFQDILDEEFQMRTQAMVNNKINRHQVWFCNQSQIPKSMLKPSTKIKSLGEEAYELIIHQKGIQIIGNSEKGLRWGLMTLFQMMEKKNNDLIIPAAKILDWPHYPWRGYMLDTGRAPYSVAQIKRTIRICSVFKLNFLMLREGDDELNAFKYNHLPLGQKNPHALNLTELADIVDYGEKRGIVVFPEIESLGHAAAKKLHYPDLIEGDMFTEYWPGFSHMRKANLKVGNPKTYNLLESIYTELFPVFKHPMVHLGLDEVRLPIKDQAEHFARLLPIVDKVGKKNGREMEMIVWSDGPPTPPEYHDRVIRCLWQYDRAISPDNKNVQEQGFNYLTQANCRQKVFMAGGSGTLHTPNSKGNYRGAFENLATWAMLGEKYQNFIGVLAVQWGANIIDEWFPNFLMAADFGWNVPKEIPDYESYITKLTTNLQKLKDYIDPDADAVDRPAWDGIWLNGRNWDEDIMSGKKAAPVVHIDSSGSFFDAKSLSIKINSNFPNAKIYYSLDGSEPTRKSNLYIEPFQVKEIATIRARAFVAGRPPSYIATQTFSNGLEYDYYQIPVQSVSELSKHKATRFSEISQVKIVPCTQNVEAFGIIFNGYIDIQKEGLYTFYLLSNDGSKLYVNNKELVDNDGLHGVREKSGKISLPVGQYPIKVKYFQNGGEHNLMLSWEGAGCSKQEIPATVLFHKTSGSIPVEGRVQDLINKAGNADDDNVRLEILRELSQLPNIEEQLKVDTERLIAEIKKWLYDKSLIYFEAQVRMNDEYHFGIRKSSPLYPIIQIYQARMLFWAMLGYDGYWNTPKMRRERFDLIRGLFEQSKENFPENRIIRMYLGEIIPPSKHYESPAGAPEWAVYQREGIERLTDIIEWWIDHKQQKNGEYGGDWDDDCEMWRWWAPVLIAFDDPKISKAQATFSRGLLGLDKMRSGYTGYISDVEHSAEPSADALTPMMHIDPENIEWGQKALRLGELMETFWTGINERGFLQFKSTYFSADSISPEPKTACGTVYHPRTVQPTLLYWQRTGNKQLENLFVAWMDTWVDATVRAEKGKPAGIIPSAVHWPDGQIGGLGENWWDPKNHQLEFDNHLYRWPSAMPMMLNTLLLTNHITQDPKYLQPIWSMAKIRLEYLQNPPNQPPAPGSKTWCGSKLGMISPIIAKYIMLGGTTKYNQLIKTDATPYATFRFNGDQESLVAALHDNVEALRINFPGYTSEVRYTDRVLRFPGIFVANGIYPDANPDILLPNTNVLYATLTGDPGNAGYFPINAVRWMTPPRDIAALVTETGRDRFQAELFHFGGKPRDMSALFYLLDPGEYIFKLFSKGTKEKEYSVKRIVVSDKNTPITFQLPAKTLCILEISKTEN